MTKAASVVQAVADDELVVDFKADVLDRYVDLSAAGLAEQTGSPQACRISGVEDVLQIREREPGVDDVFDDDHMPVFQRDIEILEKPNLARALGRGPVT